MSSTERKSKRTRKAKKCAAFDRCIGSKAEVMHGTAQKTKGGVMKDGLAYNKHGRIVFKSKAAAAKKNQNLVKAGYSHRRDHVFGAVYNGTPVPMKSIRR